MSKWLFRMIPVHDRKFIAGWLNPAMDNGCETWFATRAEATRWLYRAKRKMKVADNMIEWSGVTPAPEQMELFS